MVFVHGMLDPYFKRAFPLKHAKKWVSWVGAEYWLLRRARRVVFTTDLERRLAEQSFWMWRWKPMVMALGAEPVGVDADVAREAFHAICPGARGERFLLFLGRVIRKKGCDLLVEAFARCAGEDAGLHLVMAGPDPAVGGRS